MFPDLSLSTEEKQLRMLPGLAALALSVTGEEKKNGNEKHRLALGW